MYHGQVLGTRMSLGPKYNYQDISAIIEIKPEEDWGDRVLSIIQSGIYNFSINYARSSIQDPGGISGGANILTVQVALGCIITSHYFQILRVYYIIHERQPIRDKFEANCQHLKFL